MGFFQSNGSLLVFVCLKFSSLLILLFVRWQLIFQDVKLTIWAATVRTRRVPNRWQSIDRMNRWLVVEPVVAMIRSPLCHRRFYSVFQQIDWLSWTPSSILDRIFLEIIWKKLPIELVLLHLLVYVAYEFFHSLFTLIHGVLRIREEIEHFRCFENWTYERHKNEKWYRTQKHRIHELIKCVGHTHQVSK